MPVAAPIKANNIAGYSGGVFKGDFKQQIRKRSHRKSHRTQSGQYILQRQKVLKIRRNNGNKGTIKKKPETEREKE